MGLFRSKPKAAPTMQVHELRQGTQIALVDVDEAWAEQVRNTYPKQPRLGHEAPVLVGLQGKDIAVFSNGRRVARMRPDMVELYLGEFQLLQRLNRIGSTVAFIRPAGAKTPHALNLNWGVRANDGGVLGPISLSL
jgi:hypothetical protein